MEIGKFCSDSCSESHRCLGFLIQETALYMHCIFIAFGLRYYCAVLKKLIMEITGRSVIFELIIAVSTDFIILWPVLSSGLIAVNC
jgi:hypothetical protein